MNDYILFMHDDASAAPGDTDDAWAAYFTKLRAAGVFEAGSAIGDGRCISKSDRSAAVTRQLVSYIRVRAENADSAEAWMIGNPVYEAGGSVEMRELPKDG